MNWVYAAYVCGVLVALGELATGFCHAMAGNRKAALVWVFYSLAAGLLAFMK